MDDFRFTKNEGRRLQQILENIYNFQNKNGALTPNEINRFQELINLKEPTTNQLVEMAQNIYGQRQLGNMPSNDLGYRPMQYLRVLDMKTNPVIEDTRYKY